MTSKCRSCNNSRFEMLSNEKKLIEQKTTSTESCGSEKEDNRISGIFFFFRLLPVIVTYNYYKWYCYHFTDACHSNGSYLHESRSFQEKKAKQVYVNADILEKANG